MIAAGAGAGYLQSHKLTMRVRFLEQYLKWISQLETEIRYCAEGIPRLLHKHGKAASLSFLTKCADQMHRGIPFPEAWKQAVQGISSDYGLKLDDLNLVMEFGNGLGTSDVDGQTAHCQMHRELMQTHLDSAREEKQKKGRLYIMLGLFGGIGVALLIA